MRRIQKRDACTPGCVQYYGNVLRIGTAGAVGDSVLHSPLGRTKRKFVYKVHRWVAARAASPSVIALNSAGESHLELVSLEYLNPSGRGSPPSHPCWPQVG